MWLWPSAPSHLENGPNIAIFCLAFKPFYYNLWLSIGILTSQHQLQFVGISKNRNSEVEKQQRSIWSCYWQQQCFNIRDEMLTKAKQKKPHAVYHYFEWLQESFSNPLVHYPRTMTLDLPHHYRLAWDHWMVVHFDSLSQTQPSHTDLTSLDPRPASFPWSCLVARMASWPGSHPHLSTFPLVWVMGIAVLPAPPSLPAACTLAL